MDRMLENIKDIVMEAGALFCNRSAAAEIKKKGRADYVTTVDMSVQQLIQNKLTALYPHIQFMSEEQDNRTIDKDGLFWVLDPVDGTTNLIHDYQASAISLALIKQRQIILGTIYHPYLHEMYTAIKGKGSFLNGKRIFVSNVECLEDSLIAIGTSPYYKEMAKGNFDIFQRLYCDVQDIRRSGSAAIDMAYVACGRLEGYFERKLKLWDYAAGTLLIREAGGSVRTYSEDEIGVDNVADVVCGNKKIVNKLFSYLHFTEE